MLGPLDGRRRVVQLRLVANRELRRLGLFRAERTMGDEQIFDSLRRQRTREEIALGVRAPEAHELARLQLFLDAFGNHARLERSRQREDALDDRRAIREQQALDERAVDLERVDWQLVQMTQRREAAAEIVQIDLHAELPQLAEQLRGLIGAVHQRRLGDLESEVAWLQSRIMNGLLDDPQEILLHELPARHVDGNVVEAAARKSPLPVCERVARL